MCVYNVYAFKFSIFTFCISSINFRRLHCELCLTANIIRSKEISRVLLPLCTTIPIPHPFQWENIEYMLWKLFWNIFTFLYTFLYRYSFIQIQLTWCIWYRSTFYRLESDIYLRGSQFYLAFSYFHWFNLKQNLFNLLERQTWSYLHII